MPNTQFGSGSIFDTYRSLLGSWLRENMEAVRSLPHKTLDSYQHKSILAGWEVKPPDSSYTFYVLLDSSFPHSHIRIAYVGTCRYLQWPHVEENGFLCLPTYGWRPIEDLPSSTQQRLNIATKLLNNCQSTDYVKRESASEFLTYWRRSADIPALSLIDLSNHQTRLASVLTTNGDWLITGEDEDSLQSWIAKQGKLTPKSSYKAIFGYIDEPPSLPLPKTTKQFVDLLVSQCTNATALLGQLPPDEQIFIFLALRRPEGIGLIGAKLSPSQLKGFRKGKIPARVKKAMWRRTSQLDLVGVSRVDGSWIHGRGLDPHYPVLQDKQVVVLGCGSLGSQVASRLAQAGIGQITLVDPEKLTSNNVGRHALGMDSMLQSKSEQLAEKLSAKYPHGKFCGLNNTWQNALLDRAVAFIEADLIVSCIGEIDQDLTWASLRQRDSITAPTVYGWLGTQGTTGHALALAPEGPGLSCFFDPDGFARHPDTNFMGDTQIKVEPGCGTEFQPYGPSTVGQVELLVTRLSIDLLTGKASPPHHRVYACSTDDLTELGGQWTDEHLRYRPEGYEGPFEYRPTVKHCGVCYQCQRR